jgi:hypothetical protein
MFRLYFIYYTEIIQDGQISETNIDICVDAVWKACERRHGEAQLFVWASVSTELLWPLGLVLPLPGLHWPPGTTPILSPDLELISQYYLVLGVIISNLFNRHKNGRNSCYMRWNNWYYVSDVIWSTKQSTPIKVWLRPGLVLLCTNVMSTFYQSLINQCLTFYQSLIDQCLPFISLLSISVYLLSVSYQSVSTFYQSLISLLTLSVINASLSWVTFIP